MDKEQAKSVEMSQAAEMLRGRNVGLSAGLGSGKGHLDTQYAQQADPKAKSGENEAAGQLDQMLRQHEILSEQASLTFISVLHHCTPSSLPFAFARCEPSPRLSRT